MSIAAAFTLGVEGAGYLVAAVFPPGDWDRVAEIANRRGFIPYIDLAYLGLGIGLDEDTAIVVRGTTFEVIGQGGVYVIDGAGVTHSNEAEAHAEHQALREALADTHIDMVAFDEPRIINFGSGNKAGYTLDQLIETSNIAGHFVPDNGDGRSDMYLDVFSCKPYDIQIVMDLVREYFKAERIRHNYVTRQA